MTEQKKIENEATLKQLAINIQAGHRRCIDGIKGLIAQAKCNGDWLNEAKKLVEHGVWIAWVQTHCNFTSRMAHKYRLVAKHYDVLIARFATKDECTLTEFFTEAGKLEAQAKKASKGQEDTGKNKKPAPTDAFRLDKPDRRKKLKEFEKRKQNGFLAIEKEEVVETFLKKQRELLLATIKRFACSKDVKEVAGDLDAVHLGILLLEGLKTQLDVDGLFVQPVDADATDASKSPEPTSRIGEHVNGDGRGKKAVA